MMSFYIAQTDTGYQTSTHNLRMIVHTIKRSALITSTHLVPNLGPTGITRIKRKEKTIKTMTGVRLIVVSKEVATFNDIDALRKRMPSKEDFDMFVVWDVDHPIDMAFISLRSYLEKQGINCNGEEKNS